MYQEEIFNGDIQATYTGSEQPLTLEQKPRIEFIDNYKLVIKAVNEEKEVLTDDVSFTVEVFDTNGTRIYVDNNAKPDADGNVIIDNLYYSDKTKDVKIRVKENQAPSGYQVTPTQQVTVNIYSETIKQASNWLNLSISTKNSKRIVTAEITTKVELVNPEANVTFHLYKSDESKNKLGNVEFKITQVDDEE